MVRDEVSFSGVRASEALALVYFAYLVLCSGLCPLPAGRRLRMGGGALAMASAVVLAARSGAPGLRDWAPAGYILAAYFLTGQSFTRPNARFEAWLAGWDRRLLGDPPRRFADWPSAVILYLQVVYMLCFLLVPAGFAMLAAAGHARLADRYWTMVAAAELGAFAPLPFLQTRPPWALEGGTAGGTTIRKLSSLFVHHATIGANTFPSGHVAGSFAVALAVAGAAPGAGLVLGALAASIALACVVGRYHYVVDVAAGAALAAAAWAASRGIG
jgi:membrane-associated phospholipid phosphatase